MVFIARALDPILPGWLVWQSTILMLLKIKSVFNLGLGFGKAGKNAKITF
jgi:hypothetical protein